MQCRSGVKLLGRRKYRSVTYLLIVSNFTTTAYYDFCSFKVAYFSEAVDNLDKCVRIHRTDLDSQAS